MKLRLFRNSIRFRLSVDEVETLAIRGCVRETTRLAADRAIIYELRTSSTARHVAATLNDDLLRIDLPVSVVRDWSTSTAVEITHTQSIGDGDTLRILIEKDFECLDDLSEPGVNYFPNPKRQC